MFVGSAIFGVKQVSFLVSFAIEFEGVSFCNQSAIKPLVSSVIRFGSSLLWFIRGIMCAIFGVKIGLISFSWGPPN